MQKLSEKRQIVHYGRLLHQKAFVAGFDGNLSIRLPDGNILITPSGASKGFLDEDDLVIISPSGDIISGDKKPSSETPMHIYVYKMRPEVNACCHAHPPYATAFSIVEEALPHNILPEAIVSVGQIPLVEYAPPGTDEVPRTLEKYISDADAFLLRNHGVLTIGEGMETAYNRMETTEHYARIVYLAKNMGKLNPLSADEVRRLEKIRAELAQGKGR
jgi:L-fuculose-phosphate aldolase